MSTLPGKVDPHARRFGVEIECGLAGGTNAARRLFGFPSDSYYRSRNDGWAIDYDGSGVELKTPILQGEEGYKTIRWAMKRLKDAGAYVTTHDGLHIHHDAPDFESNPAGCLQLVDSWRNNLHAIHEMVAPRRRQSGACPSWGDYDYEILLAWSNGSRGYLDLNRNDLNLAALDEHGSIELRLHEGTLDAEVAISWIQFGQRFLHEASKRVRPIKFSATDADLMSRIRLSKAARAILAEKKQKDYITEATGYQLRSSDPYR